MNTIEETLEVKGMHCKSCTMLIEEALADIGVEEAKANFKKGTVAVRYDASMTSREKIIAAIRNEGYKTP